MRRRRWSPNPNRSDPRRRRSASRRCRITLTACARWVVRRMSAATRSGPQMLSRRARRRRRRLRLPAVRRPPRMFILHIQPRLTPSSLRMELPLLAPMALLLPMFAVRSMSSKWRRRSAARRQPRRQKGQRQGKSAMPRYIPSRPQSSRACSAIARSRRSTSGQSGGWSESPRRSCCFSPLDGASAVRRGSRR